MYTYIKQAYQENEVLEKEYPFEVFYPLMVNFLVKEVHNQKEFISPILFAREVGISDKKAIRFFLGMTSSTLLDVVYKYTCPKCGTESIFETEQELLKLICSHCGEKTKYSYEKLIQEIQVLFKINEEVINQIKQNIYVK